jgi:hypothetical protein
MFEWEMPMSGNVSGRAVKTSRNHVMLLLIRLFRLLSEEGWMLYLL